MVENLHIAKLEIRDESSIDVAPYTHSKNIEPIIVKLTDHIDRIKEEFLSVSCVCIYITDVPVCVRVCVKYFRLFFRRIFVNAVTAVTDIQHMKCVIKFVIL